VERPFAGEIESGGKALILFALGLVFVYLTLAAQYEVSCCRSRVLAPVRAGAGGALRCAADNNVYCQRQVTNTNPSAKRISAFPPTQFLPAKGRSTHKSFRSETFLRQRFHIRDASPELRPALQTR